jgi:hypothetical protein
MLDATLVANMVNFQARVRKLRKATISYVMSVCLSVFMNNSTPTGLILMKFDI